MNRLTGDIVLEIRTFLDHESFYRWIVACHGISWSFSKNDGEIDSLLMKSGRPMIRNWLSKYVDFPVANIQFGGTQGYLRILEMGGLSTNPKWMGKSGDETCNLAQRPYKLLTVPGPNYFLDFMSDHLDSEWDERNNSPSNKDGNWFEAVIPNSARDDDSNYKWFETPKYYSYWPKLWFVAERILTDAMHHGRYFLSSGHFSECLRQYPLLLGLERQGCVEFPPHDRMFSIPSVLDRTCLSDDYQSDGMASSTAKSTINCNLANSWTVLDILATDVCDVQCKSYWGEQPPHLELVRDKSSGRLLLRWSIHEPSQSHGDGGGEVNQDDNGDIEYGYIPWCGSSETSEETSKSWPLLQRDICRWIDSRLEEFNHELDEKLTEEIVECLVLDRDVGDDIKMDDSLDHDGEALMTLLEIKDSEASKWEKNKAMRPEKLKQRVQRIKNLAQEGLTCWKKYFGGPNQDGHGQPENDSFLDQNGKGQDFATWQSIGLSNRRCLRFDPVKFNEWISKTIGGSLFRKTSPPAISLLQFAAEDLGLGLSWRIEGANGEVAAMLLGPHGSLWVKQEDRTVVEPFCVSDDDESYRSGDSSSLAGEDDRGEESIEEPVVTGIQDDSSDESTGEPAAKKQKVTTSVSPDLNPAPKDLQQKLLEKMEAIESTLKTEVANLKATNAGLKAELKTQIETSTSNLKKEMKTTNENHDCEIQILKADLHQTRLDLAKAQQKFQIGK